MNLNYLSCSKENNIRVNTSLLSFLLLSLRSVSLRKKARPVRESNNIEDNVRRISVKVSCRHKFQTVKPQITFRLRLTRSTRESRFPKTWIHRSDRWMPRIYGSREKVTDLWRYFSRKIPGRSSRNIDTVSCMELGKKQRRDFETFENRRMKWKDKEIFRMNGFKKIELDSLFLRFWSKYCNDEWIMEFNFWLQSNDF